MPKQCNNNEPETCQLSYKGNQCKALNFELSPENLAFDKCENFPKILEKFISCVGLDVFKTIASKSVGGAGATGVVAPYNNDYQGAYKIWTNINNYVFCGLNYQFDVTISRTNGQVIFDSQAATLAAVPTLLTTNDMEVQAASETQWGAQRRYEPSVTVQGVPVVVHKQFYSIWLAGVNLSANDSNAAGANPVVIDGCDKRTEVVNVRLALEVNSCNDFLPSNAWVNAAN